MRYVAENTTIPVPRIYHHGPATENPTGLGPFLIMEWIDHDQNLGRAILDPTRPLDQRPMLDSNLSEDTLRTVYSQMANILLQLDSLTFPTIGSLAENDDKERAKTGASASVKARPLAANTIDVVVRTQAPSSLVPLGTYSSADEWYSKFADWHMAHLALQHNDAVDSEDDARDKYVARQLFRKLAAAWRLALGLDASEAPFRLFSEDFRPANVLVDKELKVVGVIDWEFAYAAPAQFSFDPPWWLLLMEPEYWPGGFRPWLEAYEPRQEIFLDKDEKLSLHGGEQVEIALSQRMRESWDKKAWMVNYAARRSWAFDWIWWKFLDEKFFGENEEEDYHARLGLLSEPQRQAMDNFVARKLKERENQRLIKWSEEDAEALVAEVLV
ncbi:hypothetical protein HJFPF1_03766 [Paramyrothecium foliicola]|nr:hypothetical protein HJFPF1_03766 [Paramyrothecium foliicola]